MSRCTSCNYRRSIKDILHLSALKVGDDYLVNGRWSITLKKDVKAAGTTIRYRLGKGPGGKETITADGPTTKELQIVVFKHFSVLFKPQSN